MAKFLAELLGCTLPDKGNPPLFECRSQPPLGLRPSSKQRTTIFGALTNERALFDSRRVESVSYLSFYVCTDLDNISSIHADLPPVGRHSVLCAQSKLCFTHKALLPAKLCKILSRNAGSEQTLQ